MMTESSQKSSPASRRRWMLDVFDKLSVSHRLFINEYGTPEWIQWTSSRQSMRDWERERNNRVGRGLTSPVYDQVVRLRNGY